MVGTGGDRRVVKERKQRTKGDVWRSYVRRGYDYCYAQFLADQWEKRQKKKAEQQD